MKLKVILPFVAMILLLVPITFAAQYSVDIVLNTNNIEMCPSGTTQIIGTLQNTGTETETYSITSDSNWATIAPDKVTLIPGKKETVYIFITSDYQAKPGDYSINIDVKSVKTGDRETINLALLNCHSVEMVSDTTAKAGCLNDQLSFNVDVKNTGKSTETFVLSSTKGTISENEVTLDSGEKQIVQLTVPITAETEKVDISASSSTSYASDTISLDITGQECRGVGAVLVPSAMTACEKSTARFMITVKNTGSLDDTITLTSTLGTLINNKFVLKGGEAKDTYLEIDTTNMTMGLNKFTVEAKSAESDKKDRAEGSLTAEKCYSMEARIDKEKQEICPGENASFVVTVKNTGKSADSYSIKTNLGELSDSIITVDAGKEKTVGLIVDAGGKIIVDVKSDYVAQAVNAEVMAKTEEQCYGLSLSTEQNSISGEEFKGYLFTVIVKNTGEYKVSYTVKTDGPEWSYVDPKIFELDSGKGKELFVYMAPPYGTKNGIYTTSITVENDRGFSQTQELKLALGKITENVEVIPEEATEGFVEEIEKNITAKPTMIDRITAQISLLKYKKKMVGAVVLGVLVIILIAFGPKMIGKRKMKNKKGKKGKKKPKAEIKEILDSI